MRTTSSTISLPDLLNAMPEAVCWMRPVQHDSQPAAFEIAYANQKAIDRYPGSADSGRLAEGSLFGSRISFRELRAVLESGQPIETTTFDTLQNEWVLVNGSPLADGVLLTLRSLPAGLLPPPPNAQQAQLLDGILDASLSGIIAYESIRDAAGQVVDFRFARFNRMARQMLALTDDMLDGSMLAQLAGVKEAGLFDKFVRVVETGESVRFETPYPSGEELRWYDMSVVRQGDGLVITFNDTTDARAARADLQAVIDHSQTGIFVFSPVYDEQGNHIDFRFKTINRMVAALVGQTPDKITGAVASDWFISYRETGLFDHYKYTLDTGEEQRFSVHYNVDGFDVWFDVHSTKLGADVLVTFTDYTDLKKAQLAVEQQARENKRQADLLNRVLDSSSNGIMSFEAVRDASGQIVDFTFLSANEAGCQVVGKRADELIGRQLLTIFPGNADSGLFARYVQTTNTGEPTHTEAHYKHDGLDFWLDITAQRLADGFVVTFTDVSVVKRAAWVVEQSAAELQTIIDTSQTGIFLFSPVQDHTGEVVDFEFRVANRQLASYVGQQPQAIIGTRGSQWFPGYKTNGLFDSFHQTYTLGQTNRLNFHYDVDGIDAWLDIMSTKMGNEVLVTFGDYTPLKHLQQEQEALVLDLQRSNRNLEQFAYIASHDLQEPLRKIQAFGDMIQNQYAAQLGNEGIDLFRRMQSAAFRMHVLIQDVLAYSRISSRGKAVEPVNLNHVVRDVLDDLESLISDKQARVTVEPLPTLPGDEPQLRQLFQNLISNALKFTRPGHPPIVAITVRSVLGRQTSLPIALGDTGRRFALIEVTDNGIGFEPSQAERIFQIFQRLHGRSSYSGTGIGLAIVQKVVENHRGYVVAEGRPNQGATFRVLLPA